MDFARFIDKNKGHDINLNENGLEPVCPSET